MHHSPSLPATLLKARLVNVTAPDGSVSTFDLANAPSHIDILVHSEYTLELTMQVRVMIIRTYGLCAHLVI